MPLDRDLAEHAPGHRRRGCGRADDRLLERGGDELRRPAGAYSLKLAIALRDELEGNPVSYTLRVTPATSARELASSVGTTQAGVVSVTMRTSQVFGLRSMLVRLTASDEVGNESSVSQVVKLPR